MFSKIVLATDLSPAWDEIISCAGEFKALGTSEIVLTHVITVKFMGGLDASLRAEAEPRLAAQRQVLEAQGFKVSVEMPSGLPGYVLTDAARRHGAQLLVVGPQKTARWQERLLGSVTGAVLHQVQVPVLLLKTRIKEGVAEGSCRLQATELLRHLLFPTDFSGTAARARDHLVRLAPRGIARVTVLHALDVPGGEMYPPGFQEMAEAQARADLEATVKELCSAGIPTVEPLFDPGRPLPAILGVLDSQDISLIIMGTQGKGFIKELFLGSVAHNVARLAPCPVLLIPPAVR